MPGWDGCSRLVHAPQQYQWHHSARGRRAPDKEQEEAIQQFFRNFSIERRTELKEKFISLWDKLGTIYHHYRKNLTELGIAYEGMLYRNVIEQLDTDQLKYDKYIFVVFKLICSIPNKSKNMRPENLLTATWKISRTNCLPATLTP